MAAAAGFALAAASVLAQGAGPQFQPLAKVDPAGVAAADNADIAAVQRGATLAASRSLGLCVLCHALPGQASAQQGDVGPPLQGIASRMGAEALRARLLQPERFNPDTVMPAYGRTAGLQRLPPELKGQPLLRPDQVDDVVAWLASLR